MGVPDRDLKANGDQKGAVYVLFLNADGTVKAEQRITTSDGGFEGDLSYRGHFGWSLATLGDLDGDGVVDLAVGEVASDDGENSAGAVWVLMMHTDGTVKSHSKISATTGGIDFDPMSFERFGAGLNARVDNEGVTHLLVGAQEDDDGAKDVGAVYVLTLDDAGQVVTQRKLSDATNILPRPIRREWRFGHGMRSIGDADGTASRRSSSARRARRSGIRPTRRVPRGSFR